jgi:hypothetical protein
METVQMCSVYIPGSAGVVEADDGGANTHSHVHHLKDRSETVEAKGTSKAPPAQSRARCSESNQRV